MDWTKVYLRDPSDGAAERGVVPCYHRAADQRVGELSCLREVMLLVVRGLVAATWRERSENL